MSKFHLALLILTGCTLLYRVTCREDLFKIPEARSKVDVKSIVPECFMNSVDAYVTQKGHLTIKGKTIYPLANPEIFTLIVRRILDETSELLDKLTVLVVTMVERNKTRSSLEFVINFFEPNIAKLSGCLEFLFDNGADVTKALTGYIFYSGFRYIFETDYGHNYTYANITRMMFVRIEQQQWLEYSQRLPTEEEFRDLYAYVERSLEEISNVYRQTFVMSGEWLSPRCLKWTKLFESNSKFAVFFKGGAFEDNGIILFDQYLQISREFDSEKVLDFYVNVVKTLDAIISETATDMMSSWWSLILQLITDNSNQDNIFVQINRAFLMADSFLTSIHNFENWMTHSKRIKSTKNLLDSPAINVLRDNVNYCKTYKLIDFPKTVAGFLIEFEEYFKKHFPGVAIESITVTNKLSEYSINQENIIDNMERNIQVLIMLLEDTSSGR